MVEALELWFTYVTSALSDGCSWGIPYTSFSFCKYDFTHTRTPLFTSSKYYFTRNRSAIVAFAVSTTLALKFLGHTKCSASARSSRAFLRPLLFYSGVLIGGSYCWLRNHLQSGKFKICVLLTLASSCPHRNLILKSSLSVPVARYIWFQSLRFQMVGRGINRWYFL